MRRVFAKYHMNLYNLTRENFKPHKAPQDITFVRVTQEILDANKMLYPDKYNKWKYNLKKGADGVFAIHNNKVVGYGWLKVKGAKDPFYKFGENVAYLSEYFVNEDFRGKGIYPAMLSHFVITHPEYSEFFISPYTSNVSSTNGLRKVGFQLIRSFVFVRALKIMFNKYEITR